MRYKDSDSVSFQYIGKDWKIYRADMEYLWQNMENNPEAMQAFADDERLPYWAELWPSSFGLVDFLEQNKERIANTACMDLGCGLGFSALCGVWLGANVIACDYEDEAIKLATYNAKQNAICMATTYAEFQELKSPCLYPQVMDWRSPNIEKHSFSVIWGADIAYERRFMPEILAFLNYALTQNGVFWIAEPSRAIYKYFVEEVERSVFSIEKVYTNITKGLNKNILPATVNVWEVKRKA